jgi:hypothetical protein
VVLLLTKDILRTTTIAVLLKLTLFITNLIFKEIITVNMSVEFQQGLTSNNTALNSSLLRLITTLNQLLK